jgi:hypothetical protein
VVGNLPYPCYKKQHRLRRLFVIIYDVRCHKGHTFEGWFKDRSSFEEQRIANLIMCPVCGSSDVERVPSSVTILGKDVKEAEHTRNKGISPLEALQKIQEYIEKNFDDVGNRFADIALKIHHGEEEKRNIKGTTTTTEEETLREEGVQYFKVPAIKLDS